MVAAIGVEQGMGLVLEGVTFTDGSGGGDHGGGVPVVASVGGARAVGGSAVLVLDGRAAAPVRTGSNGAWSLLWAALTTLAQHGDGEGVEAACLPL